MFLNADQAERAQTRRPILVLDETAERALTATGDLPQRSLYRQAGPVEPLSDAEIGAARLAGGVIVIAEPLTETLPDWIAQILELGLAVYPILIVPGAGEPPRRRMRAEREVRRLARRVSPVFPVYTDRIERKIHCAHAELRQAAQGAAVAGVVEALEHMGPGALSAEVAADRTQIAATSFIVYPGESITDRVDHLPDKIFFWDPDVVLSARRVVGRIRVPGGSGHHRASEWRRALAVKFAQAIVAVEEDEGEADDAIRVSLVFGDPARSQSVEDEPQGDRIVSILRTTAERIAEAEPVAGSADRAVASLSRAN